MFACSVHLDLFKASLTRCSLVASMRQAAASKQAEAQPAGAAPQITLAACQTGGASPSSSDVKLNVLMKQEALSNTGAIEKGCAKLKCESHLDDLQATKRAESTCVR